MDNLHTLRITAANTKSSPVRSVFNSRFLVTDVNSGDPSASRVQVLSVRRYPANEISQIYSTIAPSQTLLQSSTNLIASGCLPYNHYARTEQKTPTPSNSVVAVFTDPLPRKGLHNTIVLLLRVCM
jgi:hypothetical protein